MFRSKQINQIRWIVGGALALFAGTAMASEVLYTNDLGTASQFDTFVLSTEGGATVTVQSHNPPTANYPDMDGDGLSGNTLYGTSGFGRVYLDKTYYAPVFTTVSDVEFTATGTGWNSSNAARSRIDIGVGGTFVDSDQTTGNVGATTPAPLGVQLSGPAYQNLLNVDMQARMEVRSGSLPSGAGLPRMGNFELSGVINPGQVGDQVYVYKNDFGTAEQVSEWTVQGQAITADTVTGVPASPVDSDNDNLARRIVGDTNSAFTSTIETQVDAPDGYAYSDAIFTARARGDWSNWASRVTVWLSADGIDFSQAMAVAESGSLETLTIDTTGLEDFENISSLWIRVELHAGNLGGTRPMIQDMLVMGTLTTIPEPASAILLGLGSVLVLSRRRV